MTAKTLRVEYFSNTLMPFIQEMIDDDIVGPLIGAAMERQLKTAMGIPWMRERYKTHYWSVLRETKSGMGLFL